MKIYTIIICILCFLFICLGSLYVYEDFRGLIFNLQMDVYELNIKIIDLEYQVSELMKGE